MNLCSVSLARSRNNALSVAIDAVGLVPEAVGSPKCTRIQSAIGPQEQPGDVHLVSDTRMPENEVSVPGFRR
jgi:hypothetical protein